MNMSSNAGQGMLDMFGRKNNDSEGAKMAAENDTGPTERPEDSGADMPLEVPDRKPSSAAPATPAPAAPARAARRVSAPHTEPARRMTPGADSEGKVLVIGRSIALSGRIRSCEKLIVEGSVETEISGCRDLEVARTGVFMGNAEVDTADISGTFEGTITAREILTVRAAGRISGSVFYGQLEIERGGTIIGEIQPCSDDDSRDTTAVSAAESPAG